MSAMKGCSLLGIQTVLCEAPPRAASVHKHPVKSTRIGTARRAHSARFQFEPRKKWHRLREIFSGLRAAMCTSGTIPAGYVTEFSWLVGVALRPSVRFATIRVRSTWRGLRDTGLVLAGWPLLTTCMGYCGALSVGLVFALPLFPGGGERFVSSVLLSLPLPSCRRSASTWTTRSALLMGVVRFGLVSLVRGVGVFYPQEAGSCLFSSVTRGCSHGCFGTVWCAPTLEDFTGRLLSSCSCSSPNRVSPVWSTEKCAGFGVHRRPTQHGQVGGRAGRHKRWRHRGGSGGHWPSGSGRCGAAGLASCKVSVPEARKKGAPQCTRKHTSARSHGAYARVCICVARVVQRSTDVRECTRTQQERVSSLRRPPPTTGHKCSEN